jgi:hypothetical protein
LAGIVLRLHLEIGVYETRYLAATVPSFVVIRRDVDAKLKRIPGIANQPPQERNRC